MSNFRNPDNIGNHLELYGYEGEPTFDEFLAQKESEGVKIIDTLGDSIIKVQAENPSMVSNDH